MAKFTEHLKSAAYTGAEVAVVGGGAIAAQKFLSRDKVWKVPPSGPSLLYDHFDWIKFGGGALLATYLENPWFKLAAMGVCLQGGLEVARKMGGVDPKTGEKRIPKIGNAAEAQAAIDKQLKKAADDYHAAMVKGYPPAATSVALSIDTSNSIPTSVAAYPPAQTSVAGTQFPANSMGYNEMD